MEEAALLSWIGAERMALKRNLDRGRLAMRGGRREAAEAGPEAMLHVNLPKRGAGTQFVIVRDHCGRSGRREMKKVGTPLTISTNSPNFRKA